MVEPVVFRDLSYVFAAAVIGGGLAWLARQPLILGYVAGGVLISPFTPGPSVSDLRTFDLFAETGVVLLMFTIGIEFSLRDLMRVRWVALVGGPLGILAVVLVGTAVGTALGWSVEQAIVVGMVVSVGSTMVLIRLLMDRGEIHSRHGRVMVGTALVEDLAVVVLIVLMPSLGALEGSRLPAVFFGLGKVAAILVPVWYVTSRVVTPLLTRIARTRNDELFLLVALAIGLGAAALTQAAGLSLALGAFLAGLIISESDYAHETLARLLPLRDAFGALFFVTIGALIDPRLLVANLPLLGVMVALVVVGKFLIRALVVWLFRYPLRVALLSGLGLAHIGEFSFVLVQVARQEGHVGADVHSATLAAALLSILINAVAVRVVPPWLGQPRVVRAPRPPFSFELPGPAPHVVLCGFGRLGSSVGEALDTFRTSYVAVEKDPDIVAGLRARGVPCLFGDAAHPRLLELAGAERAALVVVTIPGHEHAQLLVRRLRAMNPAVPILVRGHHGIHRDVLRQAGATEVILPEFEAGLTFIRHALQSLAVPRPAQLAYMEALRAALGLQAHDRPASAPGLPGLPELREISVGGGGVADHSLRQMRLRERFGLTVVAVSRQDGSVLSDPSADTIVRAGDRLRLFGLREQFETFLAERGLT
jgi:CPA2 family monovalent cation:H+ antiporter-2